MIDIYLLIQQQVYGQHLCVLFPAVFVRYLLLKFPTYKLKYESRAHSSEEKIFLVEVNDYPRI